MEHIWRILVKCPNLEKWNVKEQAHNRYNGTISSQSSVYTSIVSAGYALKKISDDNPLWNYYIQEYDENEKEIKPCPACGKVHGN